MITFVCWKWHSQTYRTVFTAQHVNTLAAMLRRHYPAEHRLVCVTDEPDLIECETFPLWPDHKNLTNPSGLEKPNCYPRLKIFSGEQTRAMGIEDGARVVSMDLDIVITNDLRPLFERDGKDWDFVGWQRVGPFRPVVYNASLFMFRAARLGWLWDEFDPQKSPAEAKEAMYFGSDQAWVSYRLNGGKPAWDTQHGVYSFLRDGLWRGLPDNARIVCFNGRWKPWDAFAINGAPWISRHWRID
jgi:hypothetical protein